MDELRHKVTIEHASPDDAIRLSSLLQRDGLINNLDYIWKYVPGVWSFQEINRPRAVEIYFKDASLATFYNLKWQQ